LSPEYRDRDVAALRGIVRDSLGRLIYTHKTHEKAREIESSRSDVVKWINIVLTSATSGSLVSTVITNQRILLDLSAVLSFLTLAFVIFQLSFNPDGASARHQATARELWYLRERFVNLLSDIESGVPLRDAIVIRDQLTEDLRQAYAHAPSTSTRAYRRAQHALKVNEEMTFSDEEIDALLPPVLKTGSLDSLPVDADGD
jgi:hypothetical protein